MHCESRAPNSRSWIIHTFILKALVHGVIQHWYKWIVNWLLMWFIHNLCNRIQDKSFNLTSGAARFKWLLNSKQTMQQRQYWVSEFTHSFSFTPSSELYECTNVGNSEWGGDIGYSSRELKVGLWFARPVALKPLHEVPPQHCTFCVSQYLTHPLQVLQSTLMSCIRCDR